MRVLCRGLSLVRVASHSEYGKHSILHGDCSGNPNHLTRSVSPTHIADGWSPSGDSLYYKAIRYYGYLHHLPHGTHRVCHALRGRNLSLIDITHGEIRSICPSLILGKESDIAFNACCILQFTPIDGDSLCQVDNRIRRNMIVAEVLFRITDVRVPGIF